MIAYEYRLEVSIKRQPEGADDEWVEIGFCAADGTVDSANYEIGTAIQRREWETEPDMPEPEEVDQ